MIRLIDDLLDVSRITRGRIELRKERTDLGEVVAAAVEGVKPFLDSRRHRLTLDLPADALQVDADLGRLVQVFGNLIHNAAKFTPPGGNVWLAARREGAEAVVSVRDDGSGIPPAMQEAVFEMFTQVDDSLTRTQGGLGIGLTLVKSLVDLHGGRVEVRSDGEDRGTEVLVRLPLAVEVTAPLAVARPRPANAAAQRRVLVVDDVEASANTLALMLRGMGHDARAAYDGASALQVARELQPDLAFVDIAMPGMDGYEVARGLRALLGPAPVLVALTGYGQDEDRRRAIVAGFDHHLVKPTSLEALHEVLVTVPAPAPAASGGSER